ncbi:DUF6114 domain-containing protein [Streptomyces sp. Je 1-79]|uniref:DUF6114 domain-containing protein n=1 Tax=Streptomyces sp. Je 1-79 TaxID=2943847 RepID=UPI0021A3A205|nr:DUF6114 domain-containing protein [Streptomyces sp. Je 1-79]MCT4352036.1 DUF6114 domain-containing protein [Streptomyces sp. Je 1-79]
MTAATPATSASRATPSPAAGRPGAGGRHPWRAFGRWRHRRPFAPGVMIVLGGAEILLTQQASISVILAAGADSLVGYVLPVIMIVCGALIVLNPRQRLFYSIVAVLASLATWVTSNLGGFFVGMLLGLVGSSLAFGWLPDQPPRRRRHLFRTRRRKETQE